MTYGALLISQLTGNILLKDSTCNYPTGYSTESVCIGEGRAN
jgi:hypothetical protein